MEKVVNAELAARETGVLLLLKAVPLSIQGSEFFCFFFETVSLCCPGRSAVAQSRLTATAASRVQVILLPQPLE